MKRFSGVRSLVGGDLEFPDEAIPSPATSPAPAPGGNKSEGGSEMDSKKKHDGEAFDDVFEMFSKPSSAARPAEKSPEPAPEKIPKTAPASVPARSSYADSDLHRLINSREVVTAYLIADSKELLGEEEARKRLATMKSWGVQDVPVVKKLLFKNGDGTYGDEATQDDLLAYQDSIKFWERGSAAIRLSTTS